MDPVTHTFVGAVMGETRLRESTAYSRLTLIVAANLPDIDGLTYFLSQDASLYWRRGWSHGVLAILLLPLLLAGAIIGLARLRGRQAQVDPRWVVALSYIGLLSHPALDWLNNYGVRLLMPFEGTWFYGDALFIVDPWVWMLLGGFLFLRRPRRTSLPALGWTLFGLLATAAVLLGPGSQLQLRLLWMAGLAGIVLLDWSRPAWLVPAQVHRYSAYTGKAGKRRGPPSSGRGAAPAHRVKNRRAQAKKRRSDAQVKGHGTAMSRAGKAKRKNQLPEVSTATANYGPAAVLGLLLVYIAANLGLTAWSESQALASTENPQEVEKVMASPVPLNPLIRDVVIQTRAGYRYGRLHPLNDPPLNLATRLIPRLPENDPRVQRALQQPEVRGIVNWARFPWALVQRGQDADRVFIMDGRYVRSPTTGFGGAVVELEHPR